MRKILCSSNLLLFTILVSLFLSSCNRKYFPFKEMAPTNSVNDTSAMNKSDSGDHQKTLLIQPFDVLDIKISSSLKALDNLTNSQITRATIAGVSPNYFTGFLVDADGNVKLPLIGEVHLAGLTINGARNLISEKLKTYLTDPYVEVRFLTFRLSIMGEVRAPGEVVIPNEKSDLIQAISYAGDLTQYANTKKIKIIRGNSQNPKVFMIDLTKASAFQSKGFKVMPGDIIYIEPLGRKYFNTNLAYVLSTLTVVNTILTLSSLLRK